MNSLEVMEVGEAAVYTLLKIALPLILVALVVGLVISLLQALTQIQEMTLSFIPKIVAIMFSLIIVLPFMGQELTAFSSYLFEWVVKGGTG